MDEGIAAANAAFYAAFEGRDLEAMGNVWERSERVTVVHPGWPVLHGWGQVAASWQRIFASTPYIQFFLTEERATVIGDVAWVSLYENILQEVSGTAQAGMGSLGDARVAATNVFVFDGERWRMVHHHGSPVAG